MPKDKYKPSPGSIDATRKAYKKDGSYSGPASKKVGKVHEELGYFGHVQEALGVKAATSLYKAKKRHGSQAAWDAKVEKDVLAKKLQKYYKTKKKKKSNK